LSRKVKTSDEETKLHLQLLRWRLRGDDGRSASRALFGGISVPAGIASSGGRTLRMGVQYLSDGGHAGAMKEALRSAAEAPNVRQALTTQ
jgi:hypothetical protein